MSIHTDTTYMYKYIRKTLHVLFVLGLSSCQNDALDLKPDKSLVVPASLQDFQGMLDNTTITTLNFPALGEMSAGDFYLTFATWQSLFNTQERNAYIWNEDIYE